MTKILKNNPINYDFISKKELNDLKKFQIMK